MLERASALIDRAVDAVVGARSRARGELSGTAARAAVLERLINIDPTFFSRIGPTLDGVVLDQPFKQHPWVFAVISSRARQLSQVPWRIGEPQADGSTLDVQQGPLVDLFSRPNRAMTGEMLWQLTQVWLDLFGEAFWVLDRESITEIPARIWPWPGGSIWTPGAVGDDGLPIAWVLQKPDGTTAVFKTEQIVFFRTPNPYQPLRGCPPLLAANTTLRADVLADTYTLKFFENGAVPSGFIKYKNPLPAKDYEEMLRRLEDRHKGAFKGHKIGILDDDAEFISNSTTIRDMEYLSLREWARDVVCAVFGWPKWALGITDSMNFATAVAAKRTLWEENIIPALAQRERTLEAQFFRWIEGGRFTGFFELDNVPALVQIRESKWDTATKMLAARVSLQEINRYLDLGLEPQPGWDQVLVPLNLVPIEDAGVPIEEPDEPAPAPAQEPEPEEEALEADLEAEYAAERARELQGMRAERLRVEALPARERVAARRRLRLWRDWNARVLRPPERLAVRAVRVHLRALGVDQLRRFDDVAARRAAGEMPGLRVRVITAEDIDAILFDRPEWDDKLRRKMRPIMSASMELGAAFTEAELGAGVEVDLLSPELQRMLNTRVRLVTRINDTVRRNLAAQLREGIANNETIQELRLRIANTNVRLASPRRTLMIARTETGTIANSVRFQIAEPVVDFHVWQTAADEVVRPTHRQAERDSNREPVRIGQQFSNGLLHPNDPAGRAREVINCRCVAFLVARKPTATAPTTTDDVAQIRRARARTARDYAARLTGSPN